MRGLLLLLNRTAVLLPFVGSWSLLLLYLEIFNAAVVPGIALQITHFVCRRRVSSRLPTPKHAATSFLELPVELLAKVLAMASSGRSGEMYQFDRLAPYILPQAVGKHMLLCKRFEEAVHTAAFWQECWVVSTTMTSFEPCAARSICRLAVDLSSLEPLTRDYEYSLPVIGRDFSYQPWHLAGLRELQVGPLVSGDYQ